MLILKGKRISKFKRKKKWYECLDVYLYFEVVLVVSCPMVSVSELAEEDYWSREGCFERIFYVYNLAVLSQIFSFHC